jgi:hypothetical protein
MKPMDKTVEYQGYTIQSAPYHLANREKWQIRIFVFVEDHRGVRTANSQPMSCMRRSRKLISTGSPLANA